jgi:hypothetical protein
MNQEHSNMRQYTKREVAQAKTARQLMARLGYASSQATIVAKMPSGTWDAKEKGKKD